jgi:hypothetical protein
MSAPLCIRCTHHEIVDGEFYCRAPRNKSEASVRYLVTGEEGAKWRFAFCEVQRRGSKEQAELIDTCGPQGRWFEPKAAAENEAA